MSDYVLRELVESAPMPRTVWSISVAALLGNAFFGWRRGPKGKPPPLYEFRTGGLVWLEDELPS